MLFILHALASLIASRQVPTSPVFRDTVGGLSTASSVLTTQTVPRQPAIVALSVSTARMTVTTFSSTTPPLW